MLYSQRTLWFFLENHIQSWDIIDNMSLTVITIGDNGKPITIDTNKVPIFLIFNSDDDFQGYITELIQTPIRNGLRILPKLPPTWDANHPLLKLVMTFMDAMDGATKEGLRKDAELPTDEEIKKVRWKSNKIDRKYMNLILKTFAEYMDHRKGSEVVGDDEFIDNWVKEVFYDS